MEHNTKRIVKNTLLLYFRMILLMIITLYTSRVILSSLGIEDYGIYNVVGGMVAMFGVLSKSLSGACSRFLNYEMGKGNGKNINIVFSTCVFIQIILAVIVAIVSEIIGLWFLNFKMVIPIGRIEAANWVFQFSVLAFCIDLISIPYNAAIIAHEKMSAFAYISLFEGVAKLLIAYVIVISPIDRLIFYASLLLSVQIIVRFMYTKYCKHNFSECKKYKIRYNSYYVKKMFGYAGWNFIGTSSAILRNQGGNMLINIFSGPAVNAAKAIAVQVENAVNGFVTNFMTALRPQITKAYASSDMEYMMKLIFQGSRFSYYMLLVISLPIMICVEDILKLWLIKVPDYTSSFVVLTMFLGLVESISNPLIVANNATGNVRNYQLVVGGLQLLNIPISYIFLKLGYRPEIVIVVSICLGLFCLLARIIMLQKQINFNAKLFIHKVLVKITIVTILSVIFPVIFRYYFCNGFLNLILSLLFSFSWGVLVISYIGCSMQERKLIFNYIKRLKKK